MKKLVIVLSILLAAIPSLALSQQTISDNEKDIAIQRIKEIIDTNYVFAEKAGQVNDALGEADKNGKFDEITDYGEFGKALTEELVRITKDKHFLVNYNPELIKSRRAQRERASRESESNSTSRAPETPQVERIDWNEWYAQLDNKGFPKVEVLDGNIGYIKINFFQPLDWVRTIIDASMGFVTNTDALIIDLTENQGGYRPTDSYLGSFFFDEEPQLWMSSFNRPTGETESEFTFAEVGGARYLNKPIFILVSENSFSLAEKFAYSMKHFDKATIVGQVSAGAAHAINFLEVDDNFTFQVPTLRNIHPVTKTDWEAVGVKPDQVTEKNEAFKQAYLSALDDLIEVARHERQIKKYNEIKAKLNQ